MKRLLLSLLLAFTPLSVEAAISALGVPPDIITANTAHEAFKDARLAEAEAYCPLARATTYYVSDSNGLDANDGLSLDEPFATRAKAIAVEAAGGPNVAFLFERGDEWRENENWRPVNDNITIAAYGTGALPIFNAYIKNYSAATWANVPATNAYTTAETSTIGHVREQDDRLGETRGTLLALVASAAAVQTTPNSFFWDANVLTVNLNGGDPNTVDLEGAVSDSGDESTTGRHGVVFDTDGCRCENIRADGFGVELAGTATQIQCFTSQTTGTKACLFKGCEGYSGSTHTLAHWSSNGGKSFWLNCTGGFSHAVTGTTSVFNSFNAAGGGATGAETWFIGCNAKYGSRPSTNFGPVVTSATAAHGTGFIVHTTTGEHQFLGMYNCKAEATYNPVKQLCSTGQIQTGYSWQSGYLAEKPLTAKHSSGSWPLYQGVLYASKLYFWPAAATAQLSAQNQTQDISNSYIEVDMQTNATTTFGIWNGTTNPGCDFNIWHSFIKVLGYTEIASNRFGLEFDSRNAAIGAGLGVDRNCMLQNSIISYNNADADAMCLGFTNQATALINNAYYLVRDPGVTEDRDYGLTTNLITLSTEPTFNTSHAQILQAATSPTAAMPVHERDINGKRRTVANPDIGPVDFSSSTFTPIVVISQ